MKKCTEWRNITREETHEIFKAWQFLRYLLPRFNSSKHFIKIYKNVKTQSRHRDIYFVSHESEEVNLIIVPQLNSRSRCDRETKKRFVADLAFIASEKAPRRVFDRRLKEGRPISIIGVCIRATKNSGTGENNAFEEERRDDLPRTFTARRLPRSERR